ncbi:MAG TPA: putative Ig domain-containing protein [Streptosporangiaceae bacterium]|nr:putative Ig domain-containing protein [Streptosporangiaceae bacterium]
MRSNGLNQSRSCSWRGQCSRILAVAALLAVPAAMSGPGARGEAAVPAAAGLAPFVLPVGGAVTSVGIDQAEGLVWAAVTTGGSSDSVTEFSEASQSVTATFTVPAVVSALAVDQRGGTVWVSSAGTGKNARQVLTEITESPGTTTSVDLTQAAGGGRLIGVAADPSSAEVFALISNGRLIAVPEAHPAQFSLVATATVAQPGAFAIDPADGRIWITSLASTTVSAFTESGAKAKNLPAAISVGAGPGSIAIDPDAGLVWVGNLKAGTLTEIRESDGKLPAPAINVGKGLAVVAVAPDQAQPGKGIVWTAGNFLPFTFDEFSEASTTVRLTASGPADPGGLPKAMAIDSANGQLYEGTSEGLSPFLPSSPVLDDSQLFWWTNVSSADSGLAPAAITFPPPTFSLSGAPSWLRLDKITGNLHGVPAKTGTFSFTVTGRNTLGQTSSARFTITAGTAPVFKSPTSATFVAGIKSRFRMTATGVPEPVLQLGGPSTLPSGLTFSGSGLISGIPAAGTEGKYLFFASATNDPTNGIIVIQQFTLTVARGHVPRFTAPARKRIRLRAGHHAVVTIKASGFPVAKVMLKGKLPHGLSIRKSRAGTAVIAGVPARTAAGHAFRIRATAANGVGHATETLVLMIR